MSEAATEQATRILSEIRDGDTSAPDRLLPLVYGELRALAGDLFKQQPPNHTMQPTALVNEAYLKLVGQRDPQWKDRAHFMAVAAKAMRNLLIDHARRRKAEKRGGGWDRVTLDGVVDQMAERSIDLLSLEDALTELAELKERVARVVELRFFGGLTVRETAEALRVSTTTVDDDWAMAKAWLTRRLGGET
jgi:RNA polymerase sigma factor (TIGR02999 family)